ncbi:MAG: Gfo/Idh/MocA family oxidoreductase [Planctomycetaceae bacterium]
MPKTYRVAVFGRTGKGDYGHGVDVCWLDHPQTEVVAVADENPDGRAAAAKRLGVNCAFADYVEMLNEVKPDILAIGPRWIDQHRDATVAAGERGVHVFMEKPFCRTLEEADEIITTCERTHTKVAIAHPTRYSPIISTVKGLLREGAIGNVLELRARGKEDRRGGGEDLWVLGSHMLDLSLALGYDPEWCFASVLQGGEPIRREHVAEGAEGIGPLAGDAVRATYGLKQGITMTWQSYRNQGETREGTACRSLAQKESWKLLKARCPKFTFFRIRAGLPVVAASPGRRSRLLASVSPNHSLARRRDIGTCMRSTTS